MSNYEWTKTVEDWISQRADAPGLKNEFVQFFRRSFEKTPTPRREEAWFGAHTTTLSLVVGGIFLAAVVSSGEDKGIWLLADKDFSNVKGLRDLPVKSTQDSRTPLRWIHGKELSSVREILKAVEVWESYSRASELIFNSHLVSARRNELQEERDKVRLSELSF